MTNYINNYFNNFFSPLFIAFPLHKTLTVRFLVTCTRAGTTELLGFAPTRIRNQQRFIVTGQDIFYLLLRCLINVLLIVGNKGFGQRLADSCKYKIMEDINSDLKMQWSYLIFQKKSFRGKKHHYFCEEVLQPTLFSCRLGGILKLWQSYKHWRKSVQSKCVSTISVQIVPVKTYRRSVQHVHLLWREYGYQHRQIFLFPKEGLAPAAEGEK